jgi:hypothetical protein
MLMYIKLPIPFHSLLCFLAQNTIVLPKGKIYNSIMHIFTFTWFATALVQAHAFKSSRADDQVFLLLATAFKSRLGSSSPVWFDQNRLDLSQS